MEENTNTLDLSKEQTIELWDPKVAFRLSFLFSPIFSIWIHVKNWKALNQKSKAKNSMIWLYGAIVLMVIILIIPNANATPSILISVVWFFVSGNKQIKYIEENHIEYQKKSWKKPIFITLGVIMGIVLLAMVVFVFTGEDKTNLNIVNVENKQSYSKEVADNIYIARINDILADYKNNEIGADNKYKGKIIEITGKIGVIKKDIMGNLYVTLGTGAIFELPQIQAFFDDSMSDQLARLRKGQQLTVICRIEGLMINVLAKNCIISEN